MTWIEQLMDSTKELEAPRSFFYWSGLSAISAVLKDNVWLDRGKVYNLYPNIYVMLLARSGLRKGAPINLVRKLVKKVNNTKIISGRSSIQAILKELSQAYTQPDGKIVTGAQAFIVASEFTSSMVEDPAAMTILTDLYDRNYNEGDYKSLLKSESFTLKNPTVSMLVGTNEPHFDDFLTSKDVNGGFIARTFIIAESRKARSNSLVDDLENPPVPETLVPHLIELSKLKGPFKSLSKTPAGVYYNDWYLDLDKNLETDSYEDKTGTIERIGDAVLKVAILLSLSKCAKLEVSLEAIQEAIIQCEKLIGNIRKTTAGKGKDTFVQEKSLLIQELLKREPHIISRMQLNKKYWKNASSDEWDNMAKSLEVAGIIKIETQGNQIMYVMSDKIADEWKKHFSGVK